MKRTTVMLSDDAHARLRHAARRRKTSVAEVVRDAVEQYLPPPTPGALSFFATGQGPEDGSVRVDDYVLEAIEQSLKTQR